MSFNPNRVAVHVKPHLAIFSGYWVVRGFRYGRLPLTYTISGRLHAQDFSKAWDHARKLNEQIPVVIPERYPEFNHV